MKRVLPTTVVGSYPKPRWLIKLRESCKRKSSDFQLMDEAYNDAVKAVVKDYEIAGIDILSDGEMRRREMVEYFAEHIGGFKIYGDVRVWGNNYYRKPAIVDELYYKDELLVSDFIFLKKNTSRDIKVPITGPYTMVDWSFNEYYNHKEDAVFAMAEIVNKELRALEKAGADFIQLDEPAVSTHQSELGVAKEAIDIARKGIKAKIGIHICYGDYGRIYPRILEFNVDQIDLEFANREFRELKLLREYDFTKELGFGCMDVHSKRVERVSEVKSAIGKALDIVDADKLYVDPDCGLKLLPRKVAFEKLCTMVKAVKELRDEL